MEGWVIGMGFGGFGVSACLVVSGQWISVVSVWWKRRSCGWRVFAGGQSVGGRV